MAIINFGDRGQLVVRHCSMLQLYGENRELAWSVSRMDFPIGVIEGRGR